MSEYVHDIEVASQPELQTLLGKIFSLAINHGEFSPETRKRILGDKRGIPIADGPVSRTVSVIRDELLPIVDPKIIEMLGITGGIIISHWEAYYDVSESDENELTTDELTDDDDLKPSLGMISIEHRDPEFLIGDTDYFLEAGSDGIVDGEKEQNYNLPRQEPLPSEEQEEFLVDLGENLRTARDAGLTTIARQECSALCVLIDAVTEAKSAAG